MAGGLRTKIYCLKKNLILHFLKTLLFEIKNIFFFKCQELQQKNLFWL